jgi:N-acetyl sugar amidotransferase
MDTTDPLITFADDGRCNHCAKVDEYKQKWNPAGDPAALERLAARIKADGRGREYDAIMGLSGGVDSSYVAYQAKQLGLRVLVIHVDTGWNSELAVKNIENIVTKLGFELVTHVVNWEEMQDLQHAFFRAGVPNQDIPQDHAINSAFYNFAAQNRIPWALSGSNMSCECILPKAWGYDAMDLAHLKDIHRRFGRSPLREFPTMSFWDYGVRHQVLGGMKVAQPLNLIRYEKTAAIRVLEEALDWKYYGGKHYESRFTKFFQGYYLPTKWGYDKRLAHLSSLVASGQMQREEALREFKTGSLPLEEIESDKDYMARKLAISRDEFEQLLNVPNTPHEHYARTPDWQRRLLGIGAGLLRRLRRN